MSQNTIFQVKKNIRIQHCDPAGVVFTPQYFNLFVEVIEDWFSKALEFSFSDLIVSNSHGTPAMKIVARFHNPSRMGEEIDFALSVKSLKKTTALLLITATKNGEKRCTMEFLYGYSKIKEAALVPWPDHIYEKMMQYKTS